MNQDLNEKMEQVSAEPSAEVWNKVNQTLRRRMLVRRSIYIATAVVAVSAVAFLLTREADGNQPQMASVESVPALVQVVDETIVQHQDADVVVAPMNQPEQVDESEKPVSAVTAKPQQTTVKDIPVSTVVVQQQGDNNTVPSVSEQPVSLPVKPMPLPAKTVQERKEEEQLAPVVVDEPAVTEAVVEEEKPSASEYASKEGEQDEPAIEDVLLIPNFFAPDGDVEENRVFRIRTYNNISLSSFSMYIYDRRGQKIMHSKDLNEVWDGTCKGRRMPQGAYVYVINYIDVDGASKSRRGTVMLIR